MTVLISGLINIETTLRVEGFPYEYAPVRYPFYGVSSSVSGVGYNLARALHTLGRPLRLLSLVGDDAAGLLVQTALEQDGLPADGVLPLLDATPQSVILYDAQGRRAINTDLKDIQQQAYPQEVFTEALAGCELALLCNINFSRPFLAQARAAGLPVATDVHTISSLDDDYNRDFMAHADILFMSDERLPCAPEDWARQVLARFPCRVLVIGLGAAGALLALRDGFMERVPARELRPVVSTVGAGDALFAAFIHAYLQTGEPLAALQRAVLFASYKTGTAGGAEGFLTAAALEAFYKQFYG